MCAWRVVTLRDRLTLWYALALVCVLLAYAAVVYLFLQHTLWQQLDLLLHEDIEAQEEQPIRTLVASDPGGGRHRRDDDDDDDPWLEVWSANGRRLYQSARAARHALPSARPPVGHDQRSLRVGDEYWRLKDEPHRSEGQLLLFRAARSEKRARSELATLAVIMGLGIPIAVGTAAFGGSRLARRALSPVDRLNERARAITANRLSDRLPIENSQDEIGQLAAVFNETLARLERSFVQMRRFTSDVSHEMRTPLTSMKAVGEIGLRDGQDEGGYREVIGSMLEEVDRLTQMIDTMLLLSRADDGSVTVVRTPTDLAVLAGDVAAQLSVLAEEKDQTLRIATSGPIVVQADGLILRMAITNLIDNAIRYSPSRGTIDVRVDADAAEARVEVSDTGPGIAAAHHDRLFDRFYRVDNARSRKEGGAGLGLAIAQWAANTHHGRITVVSREGMGSAFTIWLPLSTPSTE